MVAVASKRYNQTRIVYESRYNTATLWTKESRAALIYCQDQVKQRGTQCLTDFIRTSSALLFKGKLTDLRVKALNMQLKKIRLDKMLSSLNSALNICSKHLFTPKTTDREFPCDTGYKQSSSRASKQQSN